MENLERRVQKGLKKSLLVLLPLVCLLHAGAQDTADRVRFSLWAQLEAYPGTAEAAATDENLLSYPVSRLKETAPFLVEGMVCGWSFSYTPYDKTRNVAEHFEFVPLYDFSALEQGVTYTKPWIDGDRLYCWVEFQCSPQVAAWRNAWRTSGYRRISGSGMGLLSDGFDGIQDASQNALKSAVREYARGITKNKPREIIGEVLITGEPSIGIRSGRYAVELDFFLNISRILWYNAY